MRLTSEFFVSALVRRVMGEGGFAAATRKGAAEAGAIFVVVDNLDGRLQLFGPAPQSMFSDLPDGRLFECLLADADRLDLMERFEREARIDPDFWVVEIEDRDGARFLPLAEEGD